MRSRIQILMTLLAMCIGAARATGARIPDDKAVIPFETRLGIVTFQHGMHAGLSIAECITCHHTWEGSGPVKACHECHANKDAEAPAAKKAFHTRCIGCHEYTVAEGMEAGRRKSAGSATSSRQGLSKTCKYPSPSAIFSQGKVYRA